MVGLMSVCKLIFLILWSFGFLIFTSCVKAPAYEFDLHLYQVDESLLECPSGWHKFRNNCYFIVKEETTFQETDILCKRYGGYLVKIDGYNTNKGLGQLISNHNLSHVWIGLQRKKSGELWWSDGQLAEVEDGFWANQSPILSSEYDLCTVMNLSTSNYGNNRWTLDHCDIRFSSICQTSACVAGQFRCSDGNGCISKSWICDGVYQCTDRSDEQLCSGSCGGHLQGILQTFHSPYYPQTYPKYSSCVWRLETPVGTRVKLKFESFVVEELYDKVIIYDGSSENDPLVGTYSGNTIPNVPYSSSNFILVIFQSDQDNQMSGFNATFSAVPKDECGSVLNASNLTQWFTSPNFPNSYPNNVICDWVIRSNNTENLISFQFISLSLDTSDFVEIRQGESVDSPLYGRYTGEHIPPVFVATSHSLFVRLYTDNTKAAIGFNATYSIGCNNTIRNGYARIMSPGYGITKYPNSINCNWTIIDPEKRELTLVFDQFDTEKDYDNVTVYLDNQTDYRHSGPATPLPIRIDSDIFFITFNPDSQVNRKGWSLTVSYDCPSLNLTDHLKINSSTTTFGTYVLFSCDKGYQISGTSVLICDIGGRWSASPPTCKVINCGSPALPDNMALVSLDTTHYLGNAVYRCNPGFTMTSGSVSICQSNGKWSLPYCTELNCPKLATSERLTFSSNTESHYVYGDIVTYNCDSNYRLIGASMTYCTANGTWSKSTPLCKAPMCPQIYILNGNTNATEDISGGDYVFVTCNHGYTLIGSPVVLCDLNGMYASLPSCQDVNECETEVCGEHTCQNLSGSYRCVCNHGYQNHPDNQTICTDVDECGQMLCNDICKNDDGGFQCKCVPGRHLYTEDTRVVKQKTLWPNKTCIEKCASFTVSNGGIIISDTYPLSTGEYIAPTTVTIHCPHGTIPDGSQTVQCQLGGTWNDTVTTCFNQQCQQLSALVNGHVTYSNISRVYNSVATYSCDQGYELHGVRYRYCQSVNGTSQFEWTGIAPLCREKMCPTLPDPTNGKAVYASTAIGSTMKYNCNCGYHLIGSQNRICQPEGLWDGRNAICAPSSVCQSPVISSSIKLSKVLPFYAVGSEINYQCSKPGYEISETTALKCVIERPTRRPTFDLLFEMKFLTPSSLNQSCVNVYVKEIVEHFKLLVQSNCTHPRPSEKIIADVKIGIVLQVDLTIELSKPEGGSFSSVCQCRSKLLLIVNAGEIQKNLNNHTLNGSGDVTCPVVRLKTVDNISITSNWTCDEGYEFVYSKDTCTTDLEPVCVKSTDCPDIYVSPTTISPLTTDSNVPISPINKTTDDQKETTTIAIETKDHSSMTSVSNETPSTSDMITKDAIDDEETSYRRSTYEYISSSSEFSTDITQKPSPTTVDVVNVTEVSVSENQIMTTGFTSAIMATSQKSTPVSVVMETTSVNQMIFNDTVSSTVIVQTTPKSITPYVTSEQQTFSPDVDSDTTIKSTTKILVTEEGTSQITAQKNISDGSVMDTTAETMETGQTTQTAEEFTTENVMTVNTTDSTIDHSDDTTESNNEDTTDLNITHIGSSTTTWENVTASNPEESTLKVTTVSKMSKVTTINSNTNTQPTPTIPDFFTVGDTSTTGSTKLTTHSVNKTINVEATTQTVSSQSGFLTTNISTVSTQRGDQPEETSVSIQTDSQTKITTVPIQREGTYVSTQTDSQTEGTSVSTQTDGQTERTSVSTQTDSQTGRTSVSTQTDSQTEGTYVSSQTDSQTEGTSVSTQTDGQTERTSVSTQTDSQTGRTSVSTQTDSQTEGTYVSSQTDSQTGRTSVPTQTDSQTEGTSVPTQTDSQTGRTYVSTQTDSQTERTHVSTQTDSQTEKTSVPTQTDSQTEGTSVSTQTDSQTGRTYVSTQTDSQTERTHVSTQTDSQIKRTSVSTHTDDQPQTITTPQLTQTVNTSQPTQVTSTSGSKVTSASVSEVISTSVSEVTSTSVSEVSSASVSEVTSTSVSEVSSASVSEVTSTSVSEVSSASVSEVISTSVSEVTSTSVSEVSSASASEVSSTSVSEVSSTSVSEVSSTSVSEVSSASASEVSSTSASEVSSTSVSEVSSTSVSEVSSTSVSEVSSASASEVTSANVSEVSSASVSESEVSSLMTQSVTSPPKTSTSKEREITLPTSVLPKYVIQIYSILIPTELTEKCKTEINLNISSILNSTAGVSGALQISKFCSKYIIKVTIETTIKMKATSIEVTKTYGLSGQIQSILTPCGESIAQKLFSELSDSLAYLPSQTTCLQSLESSNITINQWKCIDGYILDSFGGICNIVEQTTVLPVDVTTVSPHVTTISEHSRTTMAKNVTEETTNPDTTTSVTTTTAIVTETSTSPTTPTTTKPSSTTPTTTTTKATTTPGSTLPPTSLPFYLIKVAAVYTGTNLTWDGCINGMRSQIEEKVKAVSESIIKGLKSWRQCSKQNDLVLLTKTGKISVLPDKLELTAPFAIQSFSGKVDTVRDCAINGVQVHVQTKFDGLLSEVNPAVCYVTYAQFNITFSDWSCNDYYEYDGTSHICRLIQTTTTSSSASSNSLNRLEASDIKYYIPHGRLLLSVESFANVSMVDETFCLSEYRNILASMLVSQTVVINTGNLFDTYCPDIFISLYGNDVHPDDVNISVSKLTMTGNIAVKLFSTSASVTQDGLTACLGYLASVFMTVNNHILIGQSTIPSSNQSQCSSIALSTVNFSNYFSDCTSGYVRASPGDVYYLCLRDNRTKYIVLLKMSFTWLKPTNKMCIDRLMSELSTSSLDYVRQYAVNPEQPCTSDIILQYTNVTASLLRKYTTGNVTMIYELSSITETAAPLSGCSGVVIRNAETYFTQKLSDIFSSIAETCGSTPPQVVMSDVSGSYVCPDGKVWDQVTYQCLIPDGRKKRKKRSAELVRRKRSNTVDTTAYWKSSFPTCIDIEPPVFHNCPNEDLTIYKEAWGPVFVNISLPTAVDNSGISPRVTVTPADFRQPYLFRENTEVIFTAEDDTGNSAQCSIQVNLIDVYPLTCPSEVVYVPYATINDTVIIRYNNTGVATSSSTIHIQYHPPAGSLISINDHVNVMATAYDAAGNSTSCNFTYEATRDDQLPEYSIKVSYLPPNVVVNRTCSMKYGSELIWIFSNISVPQCDDYFMLVPDLLQTQGEQYLVMNVALGFKKTIVLDLDKMEICGNLSAQKMTELGNITLAPSGCNEITLLAVQEETTQEFLCPSNFTVLNKTSKFCTYCRKGTFSNITSGACEVCPVTHENIPTECTVCSDRSSHCLDTCKPGEYSPTGLQPCTKCAVGTYTDISNATICRSCPSGKSTINTGTSSLTECLAGCPIGQYSETGLVPCKPCPQMFYTDTTRSQSCTECSPGLVTTSTGSSSSSQCIDPKVCDSDVCLNGGNCVPVDSGRHFICQCSPGFRGKLCETDINECLSGPCVKGVCIDGEDNYSCTCDQGYTGYNCDVTIDNCTPGECGNGTCVDGSHTCICYEGFIGSSTCEEKNECLPDPCEHGGVCIDLIDDFACNCTETGYTGKNCSILPEKCYNGSCLNDGVCHPHNLGYSCSCAQGYTGDLCQINIDDCTGHYCRNGAVCVDGVNSYSCICQPGYSGSLCDVNTHCNDNPCVNKGSCVTSQSGFVCHCLAGYTGILCEVDIDECEHNKCNADKSTCKDGINGYTCECLPGWTGDTCNEHISQCITSPCTDGSICTDLGDDQFSCICMEGYTGQNCLIEINECRSSPCLNDGQCIDQVNGYTCTCKDSFTGGNCQHNIDMCLELPCQHNGTCLNLVDTFTCICEAGWTGQRCDTKVDNCLSLPCYNNATCLNIVNDFRCTCLPGYTGNQCQTDLNECVSDPCLHDGQCTNVIGGYFCTCTSGYTGPNCNVINQPCPVCQNEATECHNGQCVCLPGYVGPDCGKERDYWYDLYFTPGGRVETEVTRMKNRNQLSVCFWLKVIDSTSSSPVLTLKDVDSDPKIDHEILRLNTDSLHLSYWGERTINFTILDGSWNHICLTWNSEENGQWFLYINGVVQIEGIGFGSGQELPIGQNIVLGPDTANNNNMFHGIISQVNMYDSMLNVTYIATESGNCSISMPSGTVFRWQDFSSYINSGVEVIEPSVCRSGGCPTGYSGQFCNSTKDTEPPTVEYCPAFVQVVTTSRLNIVNWTEPRFSDNVEIVNIIQSHRSGQVFAYGEYDVMYIAYDRENNTAVCSFTVYVIPSNCTMPVPSSNVIMTCSNWSDGIYCTIRCKDPVLHKFVEEIPPFYKCGREGFWDPPRGEEFTFPTCAESSQPAGTIQGEMVFLGPLCTTMYREILSQNFVKSMNQWNMEFGMCPGNVCNFSNITVECVTSVRRRRRRSTKGTYLVIFDIPVNGSLVSEGDGVLPLTQLETMVKNEEFNTENFSCDPASLVVKPYVTCQAGQILLNGLCVNCARGTYMNPSSGSCELCPQGQYTDHEKQVRCQSCDLGYTTEFSGASSSSHCYKSCKTGNYFDKSTMDCRPCDIGYYQDETGKMSCKSCGNGQTTQHTESTSEVDCLSTCGVGTELSVLGICEPCVLGTYKPGDNEDSCQSCPYGKSTPHVGAISKHQCSVVSCPSDYFHNTETQKCQVCPPAYHQPIAGQNSCIPCTKFDTRQKCLSGEIDECALRQDNCDENADCIDTPNHFDCRCKYGYQGNGTTCLYKCIGFCNEEEICLIDNSGDPQCLDNSESLPVAALAGGASSVVLVMILIITVIVCKRRKKKKKKERKNNYQTIDRVHRELEVVTYPRRIPVTVAYRTNQAYSDSELSDPPFLGNPSTMWPMFTDHHEDLSKYCETSLRRPLRLRITAAMKNEQHFETISNKSWQDSSPGSSLDEYREDSHHSSPNSSISKYRADSNPKDSSPDSSIGQYKEDSLHKNDSPTSNKSDFSDSYF